MRMPKYLSPTSLSTYAKDPSEFYMKYLAENRPDREPQTVPMSVGSSFDAYVKSFLHERLFGRNVDPKFEFTTLFEAQVEIKNRDRALADGNWAFKQYQKSGALADLMIELNQSIGKPSFEFDILGSVNGYREGITRDLDVPIFGKPDLRFINKEGAEIICDWKVNGFYGKSNTSPKPLYIKILDGWSPDVKKPSKGNLCSHPDCVMMNFKGMRIGSHYLEEVDTTWADQLATYSWLMGATVGAENIAGIDQLACQPGGTNAPLIRIAQHRCRISENYQFNLLARYQHLWHVILSGHFFQEMSLEDSQARCALIDDNSQKITPEMSEEEKAMIMLTIVPKTPY